ncbi:CLUMA_CG021153, isoform A [Clunio marinus]|uniref:CLUMA_CG021153, isoform A n=1 Tax=Clunio marinus TaxID=568069 RepID=A0A1J1JAG7_9DIPT|nr:CLUMA_CG021153, isoform A [Clunio marinus]
MTCKFHKQKREKFKQAGKYPNFQPDNPKNNSLKQQELTFSWESSFYCFWTSEVVLKEKTVVVKTFPNDMRFIIVASSQKELKIMRMLLLSRYLISLAY